MANNWAIVAGINDYDFLPGAPLKFAVADALAMRSFLCDEVGFKSDQVLFCGDGTEGSKPATKSVLRDILLHQIQRAKNADNLWFFFSGHGIAWQSQRFKRDGDFNSLCDRLSAELQCKKHCACVGYVSE